LEIGGGEKNENREEGQNDRPPEKAGKPGEKKETHKTMKTPGGVGRGASSEGETKKQIDTVKIEKFQCGFWGEKRKKIKTNVWGETAVQP